MMVWINVFINGNMAELPPGANLRKNQVIVGTLEWWNTWKEVAWLFFFLRMKKMVSANSTNREVKNIQP